MRFDAEALFGSRASVRELSGLASDAEVLSNATRHIGGRHGLRPQPPCVFPTGRRSLPQVAWAAAAPLQPMPTDMEIAGIAVDGLAVSELRRALKVELVGRVRDGLF